MSRLIDADELKKRMEQMYCTGCDDWHGVRCKACPTADALDDIDQAPTINEWHYPSKGEHPTEKDRQYFCKVKRNGNDWYEVVGWTGKYWILNDDEQVFAWQYIVPPKEEA